MTSGLKKIMYHLVFLMMINPHTSFGGVELDVEGAAFPDGERVGRPAKEVDVTREAEPSY